MMLTPGKLLTEGKGKRVYATEDPDKAIVYFKDEAMAYHGLKRGRIFGKGEINNAICKHIFELLAAQGVESHFLEQLDALSGAGEAGGDHPGGNQGTQHCGGLPVPPDRHAGGHKLANTVVEFVLKNSDAEDPLVNFTHITAMGLATQAELEEMNRIALQVNDILSRYMKEINIELIDFKLEFGRYQGAGAAGG